MKHHFLFILLLQLLVLPTCTGPGANKSVPKDAANRLIDSLTKIDLPKHDKIRSIRDAGFSRYYNGYIDSATILFEHSYRLDSTDIENQYALALINSINDNFDKALILLNKIIEKDSLTKLGAYGSIATIHSFRGEEEKAKNLLKGMLKSGHPKIRREAYSIASVLHLRKGQMNEAIDLMKLRIPISKKLYNKSSPRLEHPYWDYHLIGNIFLTIQEPDSAEVYFKKGRALLDPLDNQKTLNVIKDDYNYFRSMYLLQKGFYDDSYTNFQANFENNKNGYGGIWARILIEKNLPDSALKVLNTYSRNGYYKTFLSGKAYLKSGKFQMADALFEEVLEFHQVGEWYWQHEYALICKEIQDIYASSRIKSHVRSK